MRRFVIFITFLFALFTFINAYTSERMQEHKSPSAGIGEAPRH